MIGIYLIGGSFSHDPLKRLLLTSKYTCGVKVSYIIGLGDYGGKLGIILSYPSKKYDGKYNFSL